MVRIRWSWPQRSFMREWQLQVFQQSRCTNSTWHDARRVPGWQQALGWALLGVKLIERILWWLSECSMLYSSDTYAHKVSSRSSIRMPRRLRPWHIITAPVHKCTCCLMTKAAWHACWLHNTDLSFAMPNCRAKIRSAAQSPLISATSSHQVLSLKQYSNIQQLSHSLYHLHSTYSCCIVQKQSSA